VSSSSEQNGQKSVSSSCCQFVHSCKSCSVVLKLWQGCLFVHCMHISISICGVTKTKTSRIFCPRILVWISEEYIRNICLLIEEDEAMNSVM